LPHPTNEVENLDSLHGCFQVYFFLIHIISLFNQNNYEKSGNISLQLKTQKKYNLHQQDMKVENNNVIKTHKKGNKHNYLIILFVCIHQPNMIIVMCLTSTFPQFGRDIFS